MRRIDLELGSPRSRIRFRHGRKPEHGTLPFQILAVQDLKKPAAADPHHRNRSRTEAGDFFIPVLQNSRVGPRIVSIQQSLRAR